MPTISDQRLVDAALFLGSFRGEAEGDWRADPWNASHERNLQKWCNLHLSSDLNCVGCEIVGRIDVLWIRNCRYFAPFGEFCQAASLPGYASPGQSVADPSWWCARCFASLQMVQVPTRRIGDPQIEEVEHGRNNADKQNEKRRGKFCKLMSAGLPSFCTVFHRATPFGQMGRLGQISLLK